MTSQAHDKGILIILLRNLDALCLCKASSQTADVISDGSNDIDRQYCWGECINSKISSYPQ